MAKLTIYLTFDGNCEEAFNFYRSVLGGEFESISRFKDMPPQEGMPPVSDKDKERIMHVSLPVSSDSVLMGSDTSGSHGPDLRIGNNFSISLNADTRKEADSLFEALSKDGKKTMPMSETFWGSYFGMLTDKFGINWMISYALEDQ